MNTQNRSSVVTLNRDAIKAALDGKWSAAVEINSQFLKILPNDPDAKIRMGRALLQLRQFSKAAKYFREVLKSDPINKVARKNLKLALEKKLEKVSASAKSIIKEPGTSFEAKMQIAAKNLSAEDFSPGDGLKTKLNRSSVNVYTQEGKLLGRINSEAAKSLRRARAKKAVIGAFFAGGKGDRMKVVLKSDIPIFKSEKQEVKPYMKKGFIDEPEIEMDLVEIEET